MSVSTFGKYLVVYPFLMRGLYLLRQSVEPFYMDSICLLDLVRTSAPDHWLKHPTWSHMMKDVNQTCEQHTGVTMGEHFDQIYNAGIVEYKIFWGVFGLLAAASLLLFFQRLFTGKVKSFVGVIACLVLAWNQGSLFHLLSHYQNDVSHVNGNVMHHSNYTRDGDNASLVNTLPPGLIINFLQNYFTVMFMAYIMFTYYFKSIDKWTYFSLCTPLIMFKFVLQMAYIHPFIHTQHKSWYGTHLSPLFTKYIMDEYKGHVHCHHVTGSCLGDSPVYSWWYDALLEAHGWIFKQGLVQFKSLQYYVLNIGIDYFLLASVVLHLFVTIALLYPFLPKISQSKKQAKAEKAL